MHLTPREHERLLLAAAADLARRRLARGAPLGATEAVALVCDEVCELAWDGVPLPEVIDRARAVIPPAALLPGVAALVPVIEVEALFPWGSTLVHVDAPFAEHQAADWEVPGQGQEQGAAERVRPAPGTARSPADGPGGPGIQGAPDGPDSRSGSGGPAGSGESGGLAGSGPPGGLGEPGGRGGSGGPSGPAGSGESGGPAGSGPPGGLGEPGGRGEPDGPSGPADSGESGGPAASGPPGGLGEPGGQGEPDGPSGPADSGESGGPAASGPPGGLGELGRPADDARPAVPGVRYGPGAVLPRAGVIELAAGAVRRAALLRNTGPRDVWISSHFPLGEVNPAVRLRWAAGTEPTVPAERGLRLDLPAGDALLLRAGEEREVTVVVRSG